MLTNKQANRLIHEKSPYLLQHAHNPVDWFPWSDEAFQKAKSEDKPIFLSIGYSTCHWCHVMERECFEDVEVAQVLNQHFISIKVDREERPDINNIYMSVCQALTGQGGWPLSIFMTPEAKPFYAGTYFPKKDKMGMPGFINILEQIAHLWYTEKEDLINSGEEITQAIHNPIDLSTDTDIDIDEIIHHAYSEFTSRFDREYGGFGSAPKFPTPHNLLFLLRYWYTTGESNALEMVKKTLDSMYKGGLYDHIGFGFCRYSTDRKWSVPHFEKMLYDNALISISLLETYQASKEKRYASFAEEIFTYILRDMTSDEGGFFSAEDADSEGVEGKFYTWTKREVLDVLGSSYGDYFCESFGITDKGNFEHVNIPNLLNSNINSLDKERITKCKEKLFKHRENRIHTYKDDKILTSWNALMIVAFAMGGRILGKDTYTQAAINAVDFIYKKLIRKDGRLLARYRAGESAFPAYVNDYAYLVWGLLELYETTYRTDFLDKAIRLNENMMDLFWDDAASGLFLYGHDGEKLILRPKEIYDGAIPSGNSVAAYSLIRLSKLTGKTHYEDAAHDIFKAFSSDITNYPGAYAFILCAMMAYKCPSTEIVIAGYKDNTETISMLNLLKEHYLPFTTSIVSDGCDETITRLAPFISSYKIVDNKTSAHICRNFTCSAPVFDVQSLKEQLTPDIRN